MADAEASRRAREAPVGDQRHLFAHALAVKRRRGRQHLAHAGAALRPFVADDDDRTFLDLTRLARGEAILLALEHMRRAAELQAVPKSEGRRVGKECGRTSRSRGWQVQQKKPKE